MHSDENQLKLVEITLDEVKNSTVKYANLFFVDKNFACLCETKIQCKCLNLTKTQISKIKRKDNNRISLFLNHADKSVNYIIRLIDYNLIRDTPIGVFFIKSIISKNIDRVLIHSHNATLHADFFASLKCAILNNPLILYYCFIPEPTLIKTIYKQNNYAASKLFY